MAKIHQRKTDELWLDLYNREAIIKDLVFLYHACVASEQLLALAAHQSLKEGSFYQRLRKYYQIHLEEEKGEIVILREDLASETIQVGTPNQCVMGMIGTQYYMLYHVDPVCLLGYLAVQEATPTSLKAVETLEEVYGCSLFRFIRMHAVKDLEHGREIENLLDAAPKELQGPISWSADNVLDYYAQEIKTYG